MAPTRKKKVTPEKTAKKVKRDKEGKTEEKNEEVEGDLEHRAESAQNIFVRKLDEIEYSGLGYHKWLMEHIEKQGKEE